MSLPIALTIAGSDSGGGAGIQADLKTFAALGVHGTTVITCITAQNPRRVIGIQACTPEMVARQLEAVFTELPPAAAKTGMLYSAEIIEAVAESFRGKRARSTWLVVDPVMVASSGAVLLKPNAIKALVSALLPLADLLTPNLHEAELLTREKLHTPEDLRRGARMLHERYGCSVLMKGGHLKHLTEAVDVFWDGRQELLLKAPFVRGASTHGTGCTYSAAITGGLARNLSLLDAVARAKEYITQAIARSEQVGRHSTLHHAHPCRWTKQTFR